VGQLLDVVGIGITVSWFVLEMQKKDRLAPVFFLFGVPTNGGHLPADRYSDLLIVKDP
jgi:hypothetical protein